jgi:hypothetical protein
MSDVESAKNEWIDHHIEWCEGEIAKEKGFLAQVADGWRFSEAKGNERMRDVTEERAADSRRTIENLERVVAAYKRRSGSQ